MLSFDSSHGIGQVADELIVDILARLQQDGLATLTDEVLHQGNHHVGTQRVVHRLVLTANGAIVALLAANIRNLYHAAHLSPVLRKEFESSFLSQGEKRLLGIAASKQCLSQHFIRILLVIEHFKKWIILFLHFLSPT